MRFKPSYPLYLRGLAFCAAMVISTTPAALAETEKTVPGISMSAGVFTHFCIDHRADISALIELLPEQGYNWMADTKRFMHPKHDLSFAMVQTASGFVCSMEFANHIDTADPAALFVKKTNSRRVTVSVGVPDDPKEHNYVQAFVAAEVQQTQ